MPRSVLPEVPKVAGSKHFFSLTTFARAEECDVCSLLLWGMVNQGYHCDGCAMRLHKHCVPKLKKRFSHPAIAHAASML